MLKPHTSVISGELGIAIWQCQKTIDLLEQGATIPFIARYRKEMTGSLDEIQLSQIRDRLNQLKEMDKRRDSILESLKESGNWTTDLEKQLNNASSQAELEDIYLPFRPKRKTRATVAKARGLEPLARMIMAQNPIDIEQKAFLFLDKTKEVNTIEEALAGARDIIAEWVSENAAARGKIRLLFKNEGIIRSKGITGKEKEGANYNNWFSWEEKISKIPSHRLLAILRGENEAFLRVNISPPEEKAFEILENSFVKTNNPSGQQVKTAVHDGYKRLMAPSLETEIRQMAKVKADKEAIRVFVENLRQLLLSPPLGQKNVLAIDPGFRSGCKVVSLDRQGNLLHNETIFPHPPQREEKEAIKKILNLVNSYKIEAIAIGNGTAGRETEDFIRKIRFDRDLIAVMVNESGASVYSASAVAREEFPEYDVTVRGAVSIGRRLIDPLAELVKIDPKSIGVGQYQHDVDQKELQKSLEDTVISCVNHVGVELNTASKQLLSCVSGIGPALASNIIEYRNQNGPFKKRDNLKKVSRFGEKAFEQAAGFLRIREGINPLDNSAIHPESYTVVNKMADDLGRSVQELIQDKNLRQKIELNKYVCEKTGLPTLTDIIAELDKPGRDPRNKFSTFEFDKSINKLEDLVPGMILPGIVMNITNFGAFVDIGVHQDGLVHISNISENFIKDPNEVLKINQKVIVRVLEVDIDRRRIQLSMRNTQ